MTLKKITNTVLKIYKTHIKNPYIAILIYVTLLFITDYSRVMDLYGENFVRRCINMARRRDPATYKNKLKPFCEASKKMLNQEDIKKLQSIKIPKRRDISVISRKNTTTHQCCKDFSKTEKSIIDEIVKKVKIKYEEQIGKKLYYLGDNIPTIYVYHGNNAQHLWHVDPRNVSTIYNVIICFKKKGKISPLQCKNHDGTPYSIHFNEGDAAIFNGGTTIHQVPPNNDKNSERTVLSVAFSSDNKRTDNKNMCFFLEGGNNYINIIKIFASLFIINFIISRLSGIQNMSYTLLCIFLIVTLLIAKYVPIYIQTFSKIRVNPNSSLRDGKKVRGIGSGRSSSIYYNLLILLVIIILSFSIKGGSIFFAYFILSDVFFPSSWVAYD